MTSISSRRAVGMGVLGLLGVSALAQGQSYYYGGVSAGQATTNMEEQRITQTQLGPSFAVTAIHKDERDTSYKAFGGYQFSRYMALEGGYFHLGNPKFRADTSPTGTLHGQMRVQGMNLDVLGFLPVTESLSGVARLGAQYAKTSDQFEGTGAAIPSDPSPSKRQMNIKAGVGLQYEFMPALVLRAELERYRVSDAMGNHDGVNVASLSLLVPFGRSPAASPRVALAPMPVSEPQVAQAPAIESYTTPAAGITPPVVVAVAPPERKRVTFSAESLFGFDRAEVRPEGKLALDGFVSELDGTEFDTITVEGHTDRIGTQAYNQRLSEERAQAVKDYLVGTGKVDAAKIVAKGVSESDPATQADACKGTKGSASLIACLQADRRVEIEVAGTRSGATPSP
jgi:OOP family OmpA-OmpF porin